MKRRFHSQLACALFLFALLGLGAGQAIAQQAAPAGDVVRIRRIHPPTREKTPIFQTRTPTQTSARPTDWWRVAVEFETSPEWLDELEFTFYAFVEDISNQKAQTMFSSSVTYVNIPRGRHTSDMFLHPNTVAKVGPVKFVAVVVKYRGAVVATESTANQPNWWTTFSPVPGVLLNRSQTPFAFIDFDSFNAIKPSAPAR